MSGIDFFTCPAIDSALDDLQAFRSKYIPQLGAQSNQADDVLVQVMMMLDDELRRQNQMLREAAEKRGINV